MKKILFIDSCIRGSLSRTKKICDAYINAMLTQRDFSIEVVNLNKISLLPLDKERLFTRDALLNNKDFSNEISTLAKQFAQADLIIIGAPYYDLSFPSILKTYIENIMQKGITFDYVDGEPQGLCKANKLVYITSAGGYIDSQNLGYYYIKAISNMLGIKNAECISAEGLDIIDNNSDEIVNEVIERIRISIQGE